MLRTFFWQLLKSLPVEDQVHQMPHLLACDAVTSCKELVFQIERLSKLLKGPVFCIVDGVDESLDDWNDPNDGPLGYLT
ncbi:hypothetical protein QBC40DRAFT_280486 [Triangularia verruculosa]|uniref:Uncharacterized protein n=1 Tax=Triangularia verruculosa TaxID=2587418 RepID=A0AAN6XH89_9PEZI|nr:hypothetical protein QBC40DRAFT_280486 [Triangularia verruculosa]